MTEIRVGQVWQCVDQRVTGEIEKIEEHDDDSISIWVVVAIPFAITKEFNEEQGYEEDEDDEDHDQDPDGFELYPMHYVYPADAPISTTPEDCSLVCSMTHSWFRRYDLKHLLYDPEQL